MAQKIDGGPREAFTFDDVLLKPGFSEVLPTEVDIRSRITREISLNIPIVASAMDTVTEAAMAIAMAQAGGIGVIHRNLDPELQASLVRQVKKFESGMVVNPLTIRPQATLADALTLMQENRISGIPVVEGNGRTDSLRGKLRLVSFTDAQKLLKEGSNLYSGEGAAPDLKSQVQQGYIEKSNVNGVAEMSRMIEITRAYTQIATMLQQESDLHKSAIEKLADVPA